MKKNIFIISVLCFFLNIEFSNAQKSLSASSAQGSATTSANGVWQNVITTPLTLTATSGVKVLVEATIEVTVTSGNSNLESQYQLTDGTNNSQTISRYIITKTYDDKGIIAISFIFNYPGVTSVNKNFTLQHKRIENGNNKNFTSKAVITAIEIANSNVILPNGQGTTVSIPTSSTTVYEAAATTNMITLEKTADIYIVSTFSTSTTNASATGAWSLQESTDNSTFTDIPNAQITRSIIDANTNGIGAATIVTLIKNKPADDYYFRLANKVNIGTNIITSGATISALVLRGTVATGDDVFPSYTDSPQAVSTTSNLYSDINSSLITAPLNGFSGPTIYNKFFMHASFNMGATGNNVVYATYKFESSGGTFAPFEIQRYVPNGSTGSGGLIGIVSGIDAGTSFYASFQHRNSGATGTLTSSNVNTISFFLNSDPNSTLSIEEDILNTNISIYPNPAQEQFFINNNVTNGDTSFKFYTVTGQLMHTLNVLPKTNTKLDITGWASGIYIMKATNNGVNIAKKIIIE